MNDSQLIEVALLAQKLSYSPYSKFCVGAALLATDNNQVFTGCNIESASYSMCNCAERTAFFKAISETGRTSFEKIAIVGSIKNTPIRNFCFPCGACLQVMNEFCDPQTFKIVLYDGSNTKTFLLKDLLPLGFSDFRR